MRSILVLMICSGQFTFAETSAAPELTSLQKKAALGSLLYSPSCKTATDEAALNDCLFPKPSATPATAKPATKAENTFFHKVDPEALPASPVTGDLTAFKEALKKEIATCAKKPAKFKMRIAGPSGKPEDRTLSRDQYCMSTNTTLLEIAEKPGQTFAGMMKEARTKFDWYQSNCEDPYGHGEVQVTAYHNPVYPARKTAQGEFQYPVYARPRDLVKVGGRSCRDTGDPVHPTVCPYYSREEITAGHMLNDAVQADGSPVVLGYVKSPLDVLLGQIEGSIVLEENGKFRRLNYSAPNGRANPMPSKILRCLCVPEEDRKDTPAVRKWFAKNKHRESAIINLNPSWVFYEEAADGPFGASGQKITAKHSIAVDDSVYPYGMLMLLDRAPIKKDQPATSLGCLTDALGNCTGFESQAPVPRTSTFVLAEDKGGAIKGCHVDLYVGQGDDDSEAGKLSGNMNHSAKMFFALPKE